MDNLKVKEDYYTNKNIVELYEYRRFVRGGGSLVSKSEVDLINSLLINVSLINKPVAIDCPTGSGRFIPLLKDRGYKVSACDISKPMLELAKRFKAEKYLECSADSLPIGDNSIDLVLMSRFCFHFNDPSPFIFEMARVLKDGGYLLTDVYNWTPRSILPNFLYGGKTHTHNRTDVEAIANKCGLQIIKSKGLFFLPAYIYSLMPLFLANLIEKITGKLFPNCKSKTYYLLKK